MNASNVFKWSKEYLVKILSEGNNPILKDPILMNAFNVVDRKDFVPLNLVSQAYNDVELDIGYGERLSKPTIIAHMISLLNPKVGGKYLDLGSGTGFSAAIIAYVTGNTGKVYSIERTQWLWETARTNIQKYRDLKDIIQFVYRDGSDGLVNQAPFDGIHISYAIDNVSENLKMQLKMEGGILVHPDTQGYLRVIKRTSLNDFEEERIPGFILQLGKSGVS